VLLDFLFKEENFHGNNENYFDPNNSYINKVSISTLFIDFFGKKKKIDRLN